MAGNIIDDLFFPGNTVQVEYREDLLTKRILLTSVKSTDESKIELLLPMRGEEKFVPIKLGIGVMLSAKPNDSSEISYYASELLDHKDGHPPRLIVKRPSLVQTLSRRDFFRCEVDFSFICGIGGEKLQGKVINLSASGLYAIIPEHAKLKPGRKLSLELQIPSLVHPLFAEAKVIRIERIDIKDKRGVACQFLNPAESLQNEITKYLFLRQRELIQKGLIKIGKIQ